MIRESEKIFSATNDMLGGISGGVIVILPSLTGVIREDSGYQSG